MNKTWWKQSVVYQIYPRSFKDSNGDGIGDLNGITEKLEYLQELGIDVIWLSPVYESPNADNGYDISDYQNIMKIFGTMEDFERMLAKAHGCNIKIVMDLVVNHTSDEHPWFVESKKTKDNPYRDYYIWREGKDEKEPNNWESCFSGPAWKFDEGTNMYYLHLFAEKQPDLNWENPKVREEVFTMMDWWCKKGIDGFRMDVISMISKAEGLPDGKRKANGYGDFGPWVQNGPRVHEFLKEMNQKVLSKYDLLTVGECAGVTVEEAKRYAAEDGSELNMVFQFEHMDLDGGETVKWNDRKIDLIELKQTLSKWQTQLEGKAWNSLYWCNHDQPRMISRLGSEKKEFWEVSAKMLGTCLHMMQGTPYIYQGEELGMTNAPFETMADFRDIESINAYQQCAGSGMIDPETMMKYLRYKSRDNARTPMQWDDSKYAGFSEQEPWIMLNPNYTCINAKEQMARENSIFQYYKKLIRLRKEQDIIVYGTYQLLLDDHKEIFAYTRELDNEKILIICNFSQLEIKLELPGEFVESRQILIHNYADCGVEQQMMLRPFETFVLKK